MLAGLGEVLGWGFGVVLGREKEGLVIERSDLRV